MSNLRKNALLMVFYEILSLIVPLVLTPYISRIIGAEGIGVYSYSYSIALYFVIVIQLGVKLYGRREIAKYNDNKAVYSKIFWSIFLLQVCIFLVVFPLYLYFFSQNTNQLMKSAFLIQSLELIAGLLEISWLFFGLEKFTVIVVRNTIVRLMEIILIFSFVSHSKDTLRYVLIMAFCNLLGAVSMWLNAGKYLSLVRLNYKDMKKHIGALLILFIPVLSTQLFAVIDKTIIGAVIDVTHVGYYENAYKIAKVPVVVITALGNVMLPRITKLLVDGEDKIAKEYIGKSMNLVMCVSAAISFGMCSVSKRFILIYLGTSFQGSVELFSILSFIILFIGWGNVIRTQYMLPRGYDKLYTKSVVLGSVLNIAISFALIKNLGTMGVAIGSVVSEFAMSFYGSYKVKNELNLKKLLSSNMIYIVSGIAILGIVQCVDYLLKSCINSSVLILILDIMIGGVAYVFLNITYELITKKFVLLNEIKNVVEKFGLLKNGDI